MIVMRLPVAGPYGSQKISLRQTGRELGVDGIEEPVDQAVITDAARRPFRAEDR